MASENPISNGDSVFSWLEALCEQTGLLGSRIDLRRTTTHPADATIVPLSSLDRVAQMRLERRLAEMSEIESIRISSDKISIRVSDEIIDRLIEHLPSQVTRLFGLNEALKGKVYLVDFLDPNANKALHIGHLRNIAIGKAISGILRSMGAQVVMQEVICDIGRNVSEALAGYMLYANGDDPLASHVKPDEFVGTLYSQYVKNSSLSVHRRNEDPIDRELTVAQDFAQQVLDRWRGGDTAVRNSWKSLIGWAIAGQTETLHRLDVHFGRALMESTALEDLPALIERGMLSGLFEVLENGAIGYQTSRDEYRHLILARADGFATEHLRALSIWRRLQHESDQYVQCFHIIGDEWKVSTELRLDILRKMGPCPLFDRYSPIYHAMVTFKGTTMKSSSGEALLIDDFLDWIESKAEILEFETLGPADRTSMINIFALGSLLISPATEHIDFTHEFLLNPKTNPVVSMIRVLSKVWMSSASSSADLPRSSNTRYLVLQAHRLAGFLQRALRFVDCHTMMRQLCRWAAWFEEGAVLRSEYPVVELLLRTGLNAVGLLGEVR